MTSSASPLRAGRRGRSTKPGIYAGRYLTQKARERRELAEAEQYRNRSNFFRSKDMAYRRALGAFAVVRRHQAWVTRIGGIMLVVVGLLLVTGWWDWIVNWLQVQLVLGYETSV